MKRLVLFDIDGTLLWPDGAGRAALKAALLEVFQTAGDIDSYRFAGKTDRATVRLLMEGAGIPADAVWAQFDRLPGVMAAHLRRLLDARRHDIRACPGAHTLVAHLHERDDVQLGLVTGNFQPTALIKIRAAGFAPALFPVGAFGHESEDRGDLPPLAVERAFGLNGLHYREKEVVIIGDTVDDVVCGRGINARSIAVLTGTSDPAAIRAEQPDVVLDDLSDLAAAVRAICE